MKRKLTSLFTISLLLFSSFSIQAQEENTKVNDSIIKNNKYGLRFGVDLSKPLISLLDKDFSGFEIMGDFRISHRFYIAAELGYEKEQETLNGFTYLEVDKVRYLKKNDKVRTFYQKRNLGIEVMSNID